MVSGTCLYCNITFKYKPSVQTGKYCSNKCQLDFQYLDRVKQWLAGKYAPTRGEGQVKNFIRRYLIEQHGEQCSMCGWCEVHPTTGKIPIQIDHIDGNSENNSPENLRLLCPNCHSLTPTYCALNKGNGRVSRRNGYNRRKTLT
jgi:hypothetical protein